ncbi:MAG: DHH family phosphoesterase [Clostridia bacterium]|nr:DHH family phosphoesterase [Clostridia bacterium]
MQNKRKDEFHSDAMLPLGICAGGGALFLSLLCTISYSSSAEDLRAICVLTLAIYLLLCAGAITLYLLRYKRLRGIADDAERLNTEIYDVFKYVADLPYAVVDLKGNVKAINSAMQSILGLSSPLYNAPLRTFCDISPAELANLAIRAPEYATRRAVDREGNLDLEVHNDTYRIGERTYELYPYALRSRGQEYYLVNFRDVTDYVDLRAKLQREEPIIAYIVLDNLQELAQYVRVSYRSAANELETILQNWAQEIGGLLREYDRDKYLLLFSAAALQRCIEDNFNILERVRSVRLGDNSYPVTISMGIAATGNSFRECESIASAALDVALQRGGDQVVVKRADGIAVYGGQVKLLQSNTSVISRVNSNQLCAMAARAGNVLIMGHKNPDYDAIGACVGAARLALCARGDGESTDVRIVTDLRCESFAICAEQLAGLSLYDGMFVDAATGLDMVRSDTLLIMVDVNNVNIVESPDIAHNVANIAIIDHHRQFEVFEFAPALSYIHPTASSASELITEMLEQSPFAEELLKEEATLLLSGIMLDTKNFTHSTGAQTFSAVHYLYGRGAHTNVTRSFFYDTPEELRTSGLFGANATVYRRRIAITWIDSKNMGEDHTNPRIAASKAADKLLAVRGIDASFALIKTETGVSISARSGDRINVQLIMERLGGGGHFDMAGAQINGTNLKQACERLKDAIDDYLRAEQSGTKKTAN